MKYLTLIIQVIILLITMKNTISAIHEFETGDLNAGLASMAVVVGTGVFQIIAIGTLLVRRIEYDNRI